MGCEFERKEKGEVLKHSNPKEKRVVDLYVGTCQ
jgi:hypothetical protein